MKKAFVLLIIGVICSKIILNAQVVAGPYVFKTSESYEPSSKYEAENIVGYGSEGIIQANSKDGDSFLFQKFSNDLKLEKENVINMKDKFEGVTHFERLVSLKTKSYLFVRDVRKKINTEGITALEFFPAKLELSTNPLPLFQSSAPVAGKGAHQYVAIQQEDRSKYFESSSQYIGSGLHPYECILSEDKSKFLYQYTLVPKMKDDRNSKEIKGMQVFDESLNKLWGGEFEMPYTERIMQVVDVKLSDAGEVFMLIKVYQDSKSRGHSLNYHMEVLSYIKNDVISTPIQIKSRKYLAAEGCLSEDPNHTIILATTFLKTTGGVVSSSYSNGICIGKIANNAYTETGYFEINSTTIKPDQNIKTNEESSMFEGFDDLKMRTVYYTPNGSIKIITEMYHVKVSYHSEKGSIVESASTSSEDIFIYSIASDGKLEWVKKIAKYQFIETGFAEVLSTNSICKGNDIHLFFLDHTEDASELKKNGFQSLASKGYLKAVTIDSNGNSTRYALGMVKTRTADFYITQLFTNGNMNTLISNTKRRKNNQLFSIQVN
jgi:hypothetical protein